jgi:nucleotide sugar dehydrogenase
MIFTFVATPSTMDGNYDTKAVFEVANDFFTASQLDIPIFEKKFIIGCTTNPGDTEQIQKKLSMFSIQVAYNPEFIAQGEIVKGLEQSDIVLIGTEYQELGNELVQLYKKIQTTTVNAYVMSAKAAEITKIGINCFLTTKISYANMMGDILMKSGLKDEIGMVLGAIGGDTRVGKKYMNYGFGFGGPCFPRDNRALGIFAEELNIKPSIPLASDEYNNLHVKYQTEFLFKNEVKNNKITIDGVSYKKGSILIEESQQLKVAEELESLGVDVTIVDNDIVIGEVKKLKGNKFKYERN